MPNKIISKILLHLILILFLACIIGILDRVNVSIAALEMNKAIGLSAKEFGFGAGIFFIGYFIFSIPLSYLLTKCGARIFLAMVMITWGIMATMMALVVDATSFYLLRFLLGIAEAGLYPGVYYLISQWIPARYQAKVFTLFVLAAVVALILGSPLSASLLSLNWCGIAGWKWMYILEGFPAIILGIVSFLILRDSPSEATWLDKKEQAWLTQVLASEWEKRNTAQKNQHSKTFLNKTTLFNAIFFFLLYACLAEVIFWVPLVMQSVAAVTNLQIGMLTAFPYLCSAIVMMPYSHHADATQEKKYHILVMTGLASLSSVGCIFFLNHSLIMSALFITLTIVGILSAWGIFWAKTISSLRNNVAISIGMIVAMGSLGGFVGPYLFGYLKEITGNFTGSFIMLSVSLLLASVLIALSS